MVDEQIYRLMEVMPDPVVLIREDGTIALANSQAATDCSVLIVGETGTGKELVARAIHEAEKVSGFFFDAFSPHFEILDDPVVAWLTPNVPLDQ